LTAAVVQLLFFIIQGGPKNVSYYQELSLNRMKTRH